MLWWLSLSEGLFILMEMLSSIHYSSVEIVLQQFLLLGIIPGTTIQLSFSDIILLASYFVLAYIVFKLCLYGYDRIAEIDPDSDLPAGFNRIELIAL